MITMKLKVCFEPEKETTPVSPEIKPEQQYGLLLCPQCGDWFMDTSDRSGEACPACVEGWRPSAFAVDTLKAHS